jgi:hypothetical protein
MDMTLEQRQRPKPGVASSVIERLKSRFSAEADRGRRTSQVPRPYSFRTACTCPDDCPRDHENE